MGIGRKRFPNNGAAHILPPPRATTMIAVTRTLSGVPLLIAVVGCFNSAEPAPAQKNCYNPELGLIPCPTPVSLRSTWGPTVVLLGDTISVTGTVSAPATGTIVFEVSRGIEIARQAGSTVIVRGVESRAATLIGSASGYRGTLALVVVPRDSLTSLTTSLVAKPLDAERDTVRVDSTRTTRAVVLDRQGRTVMATIAWSVSDPTIATVGTGIGMEGTIRGLRSGSVELTAAVGTLRGSRTIHVRAP
jgi:hypothetical protein